MAMMLITHDLGVIAQMAEQVVVMYAGRVVEQGATAEMLRHPQHPYTQGLIASRPVPGERRRRLYSIPGQVPDLAALPRAAPLPGAASHRALPGGDSAAARQDRQAACFTANLRGRRMSEYVIEVDGLKKHFPLRDGCLASRPATSRGGRRQL
jgi:peptide/nickel transport system ATP-binding protein